MPSATDQFLAVFSTPIPFILAVLACAFFIWRAMEWGYRRKIELQESMIKLVAEKAALSNQAKDEVEKQFNAFKADVAANAGKDVLAARAEKVEIALDQFVAANNEVNSAVGIIAYPAPRGPRAAVLHQ